ncbi:MAG: hypothetical protein AVDCRST_MAG53-1464 [uncultured Solirubrobacteraceae bacterium]|uniref:Uncharacterized protein n=1 Tax=uncultured Solirubrobacteraceae bacterium TaxID=1162706 RepID=A0A6J4S7R0_9ACTN|nr:MAG: hypothetical protein AVDCRST_MAG53-1464 [uncultured Solirubrobacteraceae bacterium]
MVVTFTAVSGLTCRTTTYVGTGRFMSSSPMSVELPDPRPPQPAPDPLPDPLPEPSPPPQPGPGPIIV